VRLFRSLHKASLAPCCFQRTALVRAMHPCPLPYAPGPSHGHLRSAGPWPAPRPTSPKPLTPPDAAGGTRPHPPGTLRDVPHPPPPPAARRSDGRARPRHVCTPPPRQALAPRPWEPPPL